MCTILTSTLMKYMILRRCVRDEIVLCTLPFKVITRNTEKRKLRVPVYLDTMRARFAISAHPCLQFICKLALVCNYSMALATGDARSCRYRELLFFSRLYYSGSMAIQQFGRHFNFTLFVFNKLLCATRYT